MGVAASKQEVAPCPQCSGQKAAEARVRYSDLPELVKGFEMYDASLVENGDMALEACKGFIDCQLQEYFLTLHGNPGVGKSHLLQAVAKVSLERDGILVKYIYTPRFLDLLRKTFDAKAETDYTHIFSQYQTAGLLVLDDLGAGRYTDWGVEQVEKLVEARYQAQQPTAFGTNLKEDELAQVLGYRVMDRVFDAGSGAAKVVWMGGASYRTGKQYAR